MILNNYNGITEKEIREMTHEQLIQAVIRMLSLAEINAVEIYGKCIPIDNVADAFRNRIS
jgi:hypothetical protein